MIIRNGIYGCLFLTVSAFVVHADVQHELTGCAAKKHEIQQQIDYAKTDGNERRVRGLEKALAEVNDNCTDESLLRERQIKVQEKERTVSERITELEEAKETGRRDKINNKQKKLEEAKQELAEAKAALRK